MALVRFGLRELATGFEATMKAMDNDGSGLVDYEEFIAATMSRNVALNRDYMWQVFQVFDADHSGTITRDEFATILSNGYSRGFSSVDGLQRAEIEEIMAKYDKDNSGDIDFDEFMTLMKEAESKSPKG